MNSKINTDYQKQKTFGFGHFKEREKQSKRLADLIIKNFKENGTHPPFGWGHQLTRKDLTRVLSVISNAKITSGR